MLFNSLPYVFIFLPLSVVIYYLLNSNRYIVAGKVWLVFVSLFFYGYWHPIYLILIISSILMNYSVSTLLGISTGRSKKITLILGVVFNLLLLAYFKYFNFLIENVNWIFDTGITVNNIILPLAISFFTFQQVAYLVDCYQKDAYRQGFINYCLFVTFFPQLIAGPIVHHKEMMPQFSRLQNKFLHWDNIALGTFIFSMGLFKKIVVADSFSVWADSGFNSSEVLGFFPAWKASLSYTFQLYYDFSGYSDMAIGAALLFNIRLPINFNSPYKALSIQDFWRRWHMTLSQWMRDYVYIPLGGNRTTETKIFINVLITFLLGGLWHGANWNFVAWGAMHGLGLVIYQIWSRLGFTLYKPFAWFVTFTFINTTWVFFRAESFDRALVILKGMIPFDRIPLKKGVNLLNESQLFNADNIFDSPLYFLLFLFCWGGLSLVARNTLELSGYIGQKKNNFTLWQSFVVGMTFFILIILQVQDTPAQFLYFNF